MQKQSPLEAQGSEVDGSGGDGGDDGGSGDEAGGDGEGDPDIGPHAVASWEWWTITLLVAGIFAVLSAYIWSKYAKNSEHTTTVAIASFGSAIIIALLLNSGLWFRWKATACLTGLLGSHVLSGLKLTVPVPWHERAAEMTLPECSWVFTVVVGLLVWYFSEAHRTKDQNNRLPSFRRALKATYRDNRRRRRDPTGD